MHYQDQADQYAEERFEAEQEPKQPIRFMTGLAALDADNYDEDK